MSSEISAQSALKSAASVYEASGVEPAVVLKSAQLFFDWITKVGGQAPSPPVQGGTTPPIAPPAPRSGACPSCGSDVWDNRAENYGTKKPLWACKNRDGCQGGGPKKDGGRFPWASWDDNPWTTEQPVRQEYQPVEYDIPEANYGPDEAPF